MKLELITMNDDYLKFEEKWKNLQLEAIIEFGPQTKESITPDINLLRKWYVFYNKKLSESVEEYRNNPLDYSLNIYCNALENRIAHIKKCADRYNLQLF